MSDFDAEGLDKEAVDSHRESGNRHNDREKSAHHSIQLELYRTGVSEQARAVPWLLKNQSVTPQASARDRKRADEALQSSLGLALVANPLCRASQQIVEIIGLSCHRAEAWSPFEKLKSSSASLL